LAAAARLEIGGPAKLRSLKLLVRVAIGSEQVAPEKAVESVTHPRTGIVVIAEQISLRTRLIYLKIISGVSSKTTKQKIET